MTFQVRNVIFCLSKLEKQVVMAVSVARDLSVTVSDHTMDKLAERQQALREGIQKGEPKVLGVSQLMVGVTVISYSLPLLSTEFTEVMTFGVPWWSGIMFIVTGAVAIAMEKHANMKFLCVCLSTTGASLLVSLIALIFYFVDLENNPSKGCIEPSCMAEHHSIIFCRGVKSCLLLFTIVQTVISSILVYNLFKERRIFSQYTTLNQLIPPTPTTEVPAELN
ncbi:hypothetical protein AGOR_G00194550 [Albula goreensis]|uniref:Membrane-spanning 4-domains subfamily A member 12-like n=1 Tax=Albula goreensis TaxID=1534307 RepID=A0A8T3CVZ7_9TELE|nr:hypothetical protein AGOR_G00194550 [Albula goreensis]